MATPRPVEPPVPPEVECALLWSTPGLREAEVVRLRELLNARLDWTRVLGILAVHRTTGVAWHNTLVHLIAERGALCPTYLFKTLEVSYKGQQVMAGEQLEYTLELLSALDEQDVPAAVLKGGAVARMAYPSLGMRLFNDNDLLVDHVRLADVAGILKRLGYEQGSWDYASGRVRPARRSDIMLFPISSHQTHPHQRPTPRALTLECHRLDVHFSVDLLTSDRRDGVVADLLSRRIRLGDPPLWSLDPTDMFVFCCAHFAKEAMYHGEVVRLKDLVLYKLVDLVALLSAADYPVDTTALASRSIELGLEDQVYYSLFHTAQLFPDRVPAGLLDTLRPADDRYLHEVSDDTGKVYRWTTPVMERFFDIQRLACLTADRVDAPRWGGRRPAGSASSATSRSAGH